VSRRADGEGSIRRRRDRDGNELPSWEGWITTGYREVDGKKKPVRAHRSGPTKEGVIAALERAVNEAHRIPQVSRTPGLGKNPSVEQWMIHWIDSIQATDPGISPRTLGEYRVDLRNYIAPGIGHIRLAELDRSAVQELYAGMMRAGLSTDHCHKTLRASLNRAVEEGRIEVNPAGGKGLVPAGKPKAKIDPLSPEETRRVMEVALSRRNGPRWRIALSVGCRQGEAIGLQIDDIDWARQRLRVERQVQRIAWRHGCAAPDRCFHPRTGKPARGVDCPMRIGAAGGSLDGGLVVSRTKTDAGERYIGLTAAMLDELREHIKGLERDRAVVGDRWTDGPGGGWLFPGRLGQVTDPRRDYEEWKTILELAGVTRARLHAARHTAATSLLDQGLDPIVILSIFGWSSLEMLKRYQTPQDQHLQAAAAAMEKALPVKSPKGGRRTGLRVA
jgi:integrase